MEIKKWGESKRKGFKEALTDVCGLPKVPFIMWVHFGERLVLDILFRATHVSQLLDEQQSEVKKHIGGVDDRVESAMKSHARATRPRGKDSGYSRNVVEFLNERRVGLFHQ